MKAIPYVNLAAQWSEERNILLPIIENVMASGQYVGGKQIEQFELEASRALGVEEVVALNSGTDALVCGLLAVGVGPGDEVITPPNSFVASTAAIVHLRAKPVFVDVKADQNIDPALIERAITQHTKAIMPVHLTGRMAEMKVICGIAERHGVAVVEDAAQAAGASFYGQSAGSWGKVGCFSAHPLKNLNACGDAGFIVTNNSGVANKIRSLRNHGLIDRDTVQKFGYVSRMDTIQAAILRYRLSELSVIVERRKANVVLYRSMLRKEHVFFPMDAEGEDNTWHTFVIQVERRDQLQRYLEKKNIETAVHYPIPIHLQPAARNLGYSRGDFPMAERQAERILTLPVHQNLTPEDIETVSQAVNEYFES